MRLVLRCETWGSDIIPQSQRLVDMLLLELQLPAVQDLNKGIVFELLQAAIMDFHIEKDRIVWKLCRLPAAQQLTSAEALQLLEAAVQEGYCDLWEALCRLPAAQQLGCGDVMQLLRAGLRQRGHGIMAYRPSTTSVPCQQHSS
jgi:hypothetical protein